MSSPDQPRVAVIGCGRWGQNHVRTLKELGALAAVSDADAANAASVAAKHDVAAMDMDAVFGDKAIDAVVLALPADVHAKMATRAINAGKHVFVEKPIALSSADAKAVVALASENDRIVMAGHILRYHNAFAAIMQAIDAGEIGQVRHIQSHRLAFGKFHERFDALWDLGPHDLSLVLAITGEAPDGVMSSNVSFTGGQTDASHVHMTFAGDVTAHIFVSRHSPYKERRFTVTGTTGMLFWDDFADWPQKVALFKHTVEPGGAFELSEPDFLPVEPNMALTDELSHFLECCVTQRQPLTNGAQAAEIIEVLEKAG